jgi:hypothetical protein
VAGGICFVALIGCDSSGDRDGFVRAALFPPETTIAVAPALNFSGSGDLDGVKVADLMASELSSLPGIGVIGVNRVLAILAEQGLGQIQSPEHALDVCERLGADSICVFAVTEYDAYTPVVGMVAQVYSPRPKSPGIDPVATSRMARPFPASPEPDHVRPVAQVQGSFNAAHESVQTDLEAFAESRSESSNKDGSPYGWRMYLVSQERFLRYCCHRVAQQLVRQQAGEFTYAFDAGSAEELAR